MPPRPSAVGRTPSFAPGPRAPAKPLAPLAPLPPLSSVPASYSAPYTPPDLLDGPTVTGFDPPDDDMLAAALPKATDTEEVEAVAYDDPTHLADDDYGVEAYPPPPRSTPPPRPTYSRPPPASAKPSFTPAPRSHSSGSPRRPGCSTASTPTGPG